jgi:outer membrane lipoprotein SlyB
MNRTLLAVILTIVLGVQGCATVGPDGEKQTNSKTALWVIGGLVVAGAIAATSGGSDDNCYWVYRDNGQSRVCDP